MKMDVHMDENTFLAAERTAMAADRSLMAWVRTSLALISFGFTIYKFLQYAREDLLHTSASAITASSPKVVGLFLIGLGTLALILGTADHVITIRDLRKRYNVKRHRFSLFVATLIVLLGLVLSGVVLSAHADEIVTGGNLSAEARAKIEPMKPNSTFETQHVSPPPDYSSSGAWAALPDKKDNADLAPANTKYPESQATAAADVFFVHPTTSAAARDNWNISIDDKLAVGEVDNILAFCASAFNAAAKVYAPRYREANIYAFFDDKTASGVRAIDLAYRDVERAFLHYIEFYNHGRPFILAGHSQGSIHASRLLQEHIIGTPLMDRMVSAYLIGGTIPENIPGIRPSHSATDTGALIGWTTYTKEGDPAIFTNGLIGWVGGSYTKMGGRPLLQVNPLSWELNGPEVPASRNPGSLPFLQGITGEPLLVSAVCGADASGKVLIINKPKVAGFAVSEAADMPVLNAKYGDYHSFDYTLFYESIRKNAIDRVRAFLDNK